MGHGALEAGCLAEAGLAHHPRHEGRRPRVAPARADAARPAPGVVLFADDPAALRRDGPVAGDGAGHAGRLGAARTAPAPPAGLARIRTSSTIVWSTTMNPKNAHSCTARSTMRRRISFIGAVRQDVRRIFMAPGSPVTRADGATASRTSGGRRSNAACCAPTVAADAKASTTRSGFIGIGLSDSVNASGAETGDPIIASNVSAVVESSQPSARPRWSAPCAPPLRGFPPPLQSHRLVPGKRLVARRRHRPTGPKSGGGRRCFVAPS